MTKGMSAVLMSAAVAATVGTAAFMMNGHSSRKMRHFKRSAKKTLHTVEGVIGGMSAMMR